MKKLSLAVFISALAGCATGGDWHWEKPGASNIDFNMDQGQCRAQALSIPNAPPMQVALVYNNCMQGKGWVMVANR